MTSATKDTSPTSEGPFGPLAGVRVVDLTSVGMGPYATQILGDMGAEILKIEAPEGDVFRYPEPASSPGMGAIYIALNRNKKSITLDLKVQNDLATLKRLIADADVFVSNVRPRALRKLGLDYEALSRDNTRLIYCAAVGFGQNGPYAEKPAFDDIIQAMSGIASLQGRNVDAPSYVNTIIADKVAGLTLAYSIPMALYEREKSGRGQAIEVPMFETLVSFALIEHLGGKTFEPSLGPTGYGRVLSPHRRPYQTKDGFVSLLPYTDAQWSRFFVLAGRGDMATDVRFTSAKARSMNFDSLYGALADIVKERTTGEWIDLLEPADIPVAPVLSIDDLLQDKHLKETEFFVEREHPTEGTVRITNIPVRFSRTPGQIRSLPPRQGSDQAELDRLSARPGVGASV
ncbi:CaiB/BaiF CoA transferase family protein [Paraburkholderia sp. GAS334]|uniref:CaiB/BaiF CoA transferase family protein n=1 Tax=Paraburkholderia sp. GAS334 TaxID=3035131 RepID=UPI003D19C873